MMIALLNEDRPWRDRGVLAVLTLAILLVFWHSLPKQFAANQNFDYFCCYAPAARNWLDGKGFVYSNGNFAANYPPGVPVLLAGQFVVGSFIGERAAFMLITLLCDLASIFGVYALGRFLGGFWLGRLAALALMTYPLFLWMSKQPGSEIPFIPFVVWGFYAYVRLTMEPATRRNWIWAALCGVCWALAALVRPIAILTPFIMAACHVLFARAQKFPNRVLAAVLLLICSFMTVMPWEVISHNALGRWIPLSDNASNGYADGLKPALFQKIAPVDDDVLALMERAASPITQLKTTGSYLRFLHSEARNHTGAFLKLMYIKLTRAWYATYEGYYAQANIVISCFYLSLALYGMARMWRTSAAPVAWGLLAIILYLWFMSVLVLPILRYMIPGFALMMPAVAVTVKAVLDRWLPGLVRVA